MTRASVNLSVTPVYTITGIKCLYSLCDMAYGEWLIFKNNDLCFYFNIFDADYLTFKDVNCKDITAYLARMLKNKGKEWSLEQNFLGVKSTDICNMEVVIDKLPIDFLYNK